MCPKYSALAKDMPPNYVSKLWGRTTGVEPQVQVYQTKSGQPLQMSYDENSLECRPSPPWVLHKVTATLADQEVGYLKISYVPRQQWDKAFPTVWHYARDQGGMRSINPEGSDVEIWEQLRWYSGYGSDISSMPERAARLREAMGATERHHVDKPHVDYIKVRPYNHQDGLTHRQQRIGVALYEAGARWMAERGMVLWASGLQSEEAIAAWKWMEDRGYPIKHDLTGPHPRKYLDFRGS